MVLEGRVGPAPNWQAGARGWAVRPATSQQVVLQITISRESGGLSVLVRPLLVADDRNQCKQLKPSELLFACKWGEVRKPHRIGGSCRNRPRALNSEAAPSR